MVLPPSNNAVGFYKTHLEGASFKNADIRRAAYLGTYLEDASFDGARLENVDFIGADMRNVSFKGPTFQNVTFDGVNLEGVQWDEKTDFRGLVLRDVKNASPEFLAEVKRQHAPGYVRPQFPAQETGFAANIAASRNALSKPQLGQ